jgi:hypothetical protein
MAFPITCSSLLLQPPLFVVIGMCGEINGKFELLVANGSSPKDIQIVSFENQF